MRRITLLSIAALLFCTRQLQAQASDSVQYVLLRETAYDFCKSLGKPLVYIERNEYSRTFSSHKGISHRSNALRHFC